MSLQPPDQVSGPVHLLRLGLLLGQFSWMIGILVFHKRRKDILPAGPLYILSLLIYEPGSGANC